MKVAFRVDSSSQIGTGHFMRCLTLAEELKGRGARIRFMSRHVLDHFVPLLEERGYELARIGGGGPAEEPDALPHASWLGTSQRADALDCIAALPGAPWERLVVDHYALGAVWESAMRRVAGTIVAIDDLANRDHDCDVLLDQNEYPDKERRYDGRVPAGCRLLLGPSFALLRREFRELAARAGARAGPVGRILVFFGGVDPDNFTTRAIEMLGASAGALHVDVVVGAHSRAGEVAAACSAHGFTCHVQTPRMAELIAASDLALGAGGSACWECCALGVPLLIVVTAPGQRELASSLERYGAAIVVGDRERFDARDLAAALERVVSNKAAYARMSAAARSLFPQGPIGASRVADVIMERPSRAAAGSA